MKDESDPRPKLIGPTPCVCGTRAGDKSSAGHRLLQENFDG